ncbi:unnamed protein product, partial [Effrenium voratum]
MSSPVSFHDCWKRKESLGISSSPLGFPCEVSLFRRREIRLRGDQLICVGENRDTPPEAMKLWRSLLMLSLPCLPGTVLGALGLIWAQEQPETLRALKAGLNLLFLAVSIFKLSGELPSKASDERQLPLLETTRSLEPENRSDRAFCPGLLILGFVSGFLNGLIGLPGPVCMVYVASVLKSGRMTPDAWLR